jgi:predicted dehydrogenase
VRVGFLGAGWVALGHSIGIRRSGFPVERAGVFDPDVTRCATFARGGHFTPCSSEEEVLDSCDAVYVCTWTSEHPRLVAMAAARGLAVFCEKPLATTLADVEKTAGVLREAGVVNQVGLVLRHSPAYRFAAHLARQPEAGRLMAIVVRDDQFIPVQGHYASTWRADVERAGAGTLLEHSIHDVDQLLAFGGPVASVSAHTAFFHGITGIDDVATATIRFASGASATLASVWHDNLARASLRRFEIICAYRYIEIGEHDELGPVRWTDTGGATTVLTGSELVAAATSVAGGPLSSDGAFLEAAAAGTPAFPDAEVALDAHRVTDALYRSAADGGAAVRLGRHHEPWRPADESDTPP